MAMKIHLIFLVLMLCSNMKKEAKCPSKELVSYHITTCCQNPDDHDLRKKQLS